MRRLIPFMLICAPLAACTVSTSPAVVSAKVAGSAENAYQAFLVAEEKLVQVGMLDRATFHAREQQAYDALLLVRAGQLSVDAFTAQLATLTNGG